MSMKQMPYRVPEGAMEEMRIRCHAAVKRAEADGRKRKVGYRWAVSLAAAVVGVFILVVSFVPGRNDDELTSPHYDRLMSMIQDAPVDVVYEMSVDAVEYYEDLSML